MVVIHEPEEFSLEELNLHLKEFIVGIRKQDETKLEPSSLRSVVASIERHLKWKDYGYSLSDSAAFCRYRPEVLRAKQKELKSSGKGNKPNAARSLTDNRKAKTS